MPVLSSIYGLKQSAGKPEQLVLPVPQYTPERGQQHKEGGTRIDHTSCNTAQLGHLPVQGRLASLEAWSGGSTARPRLLSAHPKATAASLRSHPSYDSAA